MIPAMANDKEREEQRLPHLDDIVTRYRAAPFPVHYEGLYLTSAPVLRFGGPAYVVNGLKITVLEDVERATQLVKTVPYAFIIADYLTREQRTSAGRLVYQCAIGEWKRFTKGNRTYKPLFFFNGVREGDISFGMLRLFGKAYGFEVEPACRHEDGVVYFGKFAGEE